MNSGIAVYYEGVTIYWSSILIVLGILSGACMGLALYGWKQKYVFAYACFLPLSLITGVYFSRFLYWSCFQEQFPSLGHAMSDFQVGGFLIPGVIVSCWVLAALFRLFRLTPSTFSILDALAPGLAFMIGIFKLSAKYSDVCRGKLLVTMAEFQKLPFSEMNVDINGNVQYRFATYFITFICMIAITVVLLLTFFFFEEQKDGDIFRLFLLLYALVEIIMDSTRYDAAHITIQGEMFEGINKASGFMGLGQLFGAFSLIYVFVHYFIVAVKKRGWKLRQILLLVLYVAGYAIAGTSEYLVQRYTSTIYQFYGLMLFGLILAGTCCCILYYKKGD